MVLTALLLLSAVALFFALRGVGEARRSSVEEAAARVTKARLPREMVECPTCNVFRSEDDLTNCGLPACPYAPVPAAESGQKE